MKKQFDVYLTRNSHCDDVGVWEDIETGITKWHGCTYFGSGRRTDDYSDKGVKHISIEICRDRYGFLPRGGTAYNVYTTKTGKIVKERVDQEMEFSDYPGPKNGKSYTFSEIKERCIKEINRKNISDKIREKAVAAIKKLKKEDLFHSASPNLLGAFGWSSNELGRDFWEDISFAKDKKGK